MKGKTIVGAVEGFQMGTMASRKEWEEILKLLRSTRYSHTRILEKGDSSCEVTMVQNSHKESMVSEMDHKTRIHL